MWFHAFKPSGGQRGENRVLITCCHLWHSFPALPAGSCHLHTCPVIIQNKQRGWVEGATDTREAGWKEQQIPLFAGSASKVPSASVQEKEKASPRGCGRCRRAAAAVRWSISADLPSGQFTISMQPFHLSAFLRTIVWGVIFNPCSVFIPYPYIFLIK